MKNVTVSDNYISVSELLKHIDSDSRRVLIAVASDNKCAIVTRKAYNRGDYTLKALRGTLHANGWDAHNSESLEALVVSATKSGWTFKVFEDFKEFATWYSHL